MFLKRTLSVVLLILSIQSYFQSSQAQLSSYQSVQPAEKIDFEFTDPDGKNHKISDFKGKIIILNFWATWCPPCVAEMPSLNNLAETFPDQELVIIPLCQDIKLLEDAKRLYDNKKLSKLHLYFDKNSQGVKSLGVKGLPTTFILDRDGYLIGKLQGGTEWDHYEVLDLIQSYIEGKTPVISSRFDRIKKWFKHLF